MTYKEFYKLSDKDRRKYLLSLSYYDLYNFLDPGIRHRVDTRPSDYLEHWLSLTRCFGYATQDGSWGELEKELAIILESYIRMLKGDEG